MTYGMPAQTIAKINRLRSLRANPQHRAELSRRAIAGGGRNLFDGLPPAP